MWILKWLPDWLFYVTLLIGVLGYLSTHLIKYIPIPQIYMYKTPIQLGSIALIVIGTFMTGAIYDNNAWLDRVKEMEEKVIREKEKTLLKNYAAIGSIFYIIKVNTYIKVYYIV